MKGTVKLFPSIDEPKAGLYTKLNDELQVIKHIGNTLCVTETKTIALKDVRLHKAYIVKPNSLIGELAFSDYAKVKEGDKVDVKVVEKLLKLPVGTIVRVVKIPLHKCLFESQDLNNLVGVVIDVDRNNYIIKLNCHTTLVCKRDWITSLNSKNSHNICYVIEN